ncbi:YadA-like family protein [Paraburkholderia fungorum]|uniref:YadA-like family protein n=1 Tax=Paraburkholderia fungorum TaxID=134537 RepID=UPI0038BDAE3D
MNKSYISVWNDASRTWVAAPETARAHCGTGTGSSRTISSGRVGADRPASPLKAAFMPIAMAIGAAMLPGMAVAADSDLNEGFGSLQLCQGSIDTTATSYGVLGQAPVLCNVQNMSFSLNNAGDAHGGLGFGSDVHVSGFSDGRLELAGAAGISMVNTVSMTGNKITSLADGALSTTSADAVNGSQLYNRTRYFTASSASSDPSSDARATGSNSVASGPYSLATGGNSSAYGAHSSALVSNSVALGANSVASRNDSVSVGYLTSDGKGQYTRQITNVTAGAAGTDAVNVNQLNAAIASVGGGGGGGNVPNAVTYNDSGMGLITLKGSAGTKITNLIAGDISSAWSTDAVNGSQLYQTNQNVTNVTGNVTNLTNVVNNIVNNGVAASPLVVTYDSSARNVLTLGGAGNPAVKLKNVAPGDISGLSSTDAVNGGQLYATNLALAGQASSVTNIFNNGIKYFRTNSSLTTALADGKESVAIGGAASATADNAVALGSNSLADRDNSVSVGALGSERQIVNLAAGTKDTDAVNLRQMNTALANISGGGSPDAVIYDSSLHNKLTLGGAGTGTGTPPAVTLTNLANGAVTSTSTDAVNGSQLYKTANSVAAALGGGTSVSPTGTVTAPTYALGNTGTFNDVGSALSGINSAIDGISGNVTNTTKYIKVVSASNAAIASGSEAVAIGGGSYASKASALAFGSGARAINAGSVALGANSVTTEDNTISVGSEDGERRIMNVADGKLATDAATVGQLDKVQAQLAQQSSGVRSMLLGSTPVTSFIAVSTNTTPGATTTTDNALDAMAIGPGATGMGIGSVAIGASAGTSLDGSTAVGSGAAALALNTTVIGASATTTNNANNAVAIGYKAKAQNTDTLAIGSSALANGVSSIALGSKAGVAPLATNSMALGAGASATHASSVALGAGSATDRPNSISVGNSSAQRQITSVAAGTGATDAVNVSQLTGLTSALGGGAGVNGADGSITKPSYAIGGKTYNDVGSAIAAAATGAGGSANSVQYDATDHKKVTLGGTGTSAPAVTLSNVAGGVANNDAVNVAQLKAMGGNVDSSGNVTNAFVAYDDTSKNTIALKGVSGSTKISKLTAGELSLTSTEAVNGTQLYQTNQNVANVAGGVSNITNIVNNITNGNAGVKYFHVNSTGADSSATGSDSIAIGTEAAATNGQGIAVGYKANATGQYSVALGASSVADRDGTVSVGSSAYQRKVVNMAAGTAATDAVNVTQLKGVTNIIGGGAGVNADGTIKNPAFTVGGQTYTDVGSAIAAAATGAGGSANSVQYDATDHKKVTLGGTGTSAPAVTLSNVAGGVANNDAVNVAQLKAMGGNVDSSGNVTNAFVAYDDTSKNTIALKGASGSTKISKLTAGELSLTSTEAVNGTQLYQTNQNVANVAGGVSNITNIVNNITNGNAGVKYFHVNSTLADSSATGTDAVAIGGNAKATGTNSVALGANSMATRPNSVDVGSRLITDLAAGTQSTDAVNLGQLQAMGANVDSSGSMTNAFVAYDDTTKNTIKLKGASGSTKILGLTAGELSLTSTEAVNGTQLFQTNQNVANVSNTVNNITNGGGIKYFHANSTLADSSATGTNAVAIGGNANASANNSVALGAKSTTTANLNGAAYLSASGTLSGTTPVGEVSVGSVGNERRLTNVAAGSAATDAVNVSQLQAAVTSASSTASANSVQYDSSSHLKITLGGTGTGTPPAVTLTNLANGAVASTSSDAVNGSQLYSTANSVAAALGGGSSVSPTGTVTNPSYKLSNGTYADVGAALVGIDGAVSSINNNITQTTKYIKVVSASNAAIASGSEAVAIGGGSYASKAGALAFGSGARAINAGSVALGVNSVTTEDNTISVGWEDGERRIMNVADGKLATDAATVGQLDKLQAQLAQQSSGVRSMLLGSTPVTSFIAVSPNTTAGASTTTDESVDAMAIGPGATGMGIGSVAIGASAGTSLDGSTAVGSGAAALALNTTVIGADATTNNTATNAVAIGYSAKAQNADTLAIGSSTKANAASSIALGSKATVTSAATNSMALGAGATATNIGSVALGAGSVTDRDNSISVGSSSAQRQIVNVAAGTAATDAVNVKQLNDAIASSGGSGGGTPNAVAYDTSLRTKVTLGGSSASPAVALTNVAAGQITSSSTDAVNGTQLYNTVNSVAAALGGGSSVSSTGTVTKPAYVLDSNTYSDVGAALAAVDAKAGSGSTLGVTYDDSLKSKITLGGTTATPPVTVANVADGKANNDAVNVQQLKAMGANIDSSGNVTGAFVAYDDALKAKVTFGGTGHDPVTLTNIAAGQVTTNSKDAINGSQLYGTANSVATALGGNAKVGSDGKVSTPTYSVSGNTYNGVGAALAALDAKSTTGSPDGVVYDTSVHDKLTLGNNGTPVTVANVADAKADDQAVNLKQLKDAGLNVDTSGNVTNAFVAYDNASKNTVTFGNVGTPVQLKNVADATDALDAVNFGQMKSYVADHAGSGGGTANGVAYDDATRSKVTLGGVDSTTPVVLTNIAAGANATDAVNYSQFSSLQSQVNNLAGGGAGDTTYININTPASGGTAAVSSGTDAIAIGNGAVASGEAAIAIGKDTKTPGNHSVALGDNSSATANNAVALGSNSVADRDNTVSVGTAGNERTITNVAAGTQATDAVNLGQLNNAMGGMQQSINNVDRSAAKGIASASALNIVTPYLPGRTTLNAGVANYRGYQAIGLGVSRWNEKGTINYNLGVSTSGGNSTIVRAGIGIVLGN